MKWKKLFHIYVPDGDYPWRNSHASNPFVDWLDTHTLMVFFSCRNQKQQSHISALTLDAKNNFKIHSICNRPLLSPGTLGLFDDSGTTLGSILSINKRRYLYYLGWNLRVTVPRQNAIGLAIEKGIDDKGYPIFEKISVAPIMDRSEEDPYSLSYPFVLYENGTYRMWYGSNLSWEKIGEDMKYAHVLKYAESKDGVHWKRKNIIAINPIYENEYAIAKPFVIKENNTYKMWYSYKGRNAVTTYRIGYAESNDGIHWTRKDDQVGIDVSEEGWDSEMICYPCIFDYNGNRYMIYNGNGYGKTGFGLAILEQD